MLTRPCSVPRLVFMEPRCLYPWKIYKAYPLWISSPRHHDVGKPAKQVTNKNLIHKTYHNIYIYTIIYIYIYNQIYLNMYIYIYIHIHTVGYRGVVQAPPIRRALATVARSDRKDVAALALDMARNC